MGARQRSPTISQLPTFGYAAAQPPVMEDLGGQGRHLAFPPRSARGGPL